jgi:cytochrome c551/c552
MRTLASLATLTLLVLALHATATLPQDAAPPMHPGKRALLRNGCTQCHSVGGGTVVGPDLKQAAAKYDRATLALWPQDSHVVYQKLGRKPANGGFQTMPILRTDQKDAEAIADYLVTVGRQANAPQFAGTPAEEEVIAAAPGCRGRGCCGGRRRGQQCGKCAGDCPRCPCSRGRG